jgi:hypothetical protein
MEGQKKRISDFTEFGRAIMMSTVKRQKYTKTTGTIFFN